MPTFKILDIEDQVYLTTSSSQCTSLKVAFIVNLVLVVPASFSLDMVASLVAFIIAAGKRTAFFVALIISCGCWIEGARVAFLFPVASVKEMRWQ